jgi:hypothetical protein
MKTPAEVLVIISHLKYGKSPFDFIKNMAWILQYAFSAGRPVGC